MSRPIPSLPRWTALCRVHRYYVRVSVSQTDGLELMQARLPLPPAHPRALLQLLEALARHCGQRLDAVISVASQWEISFDEMLYDDGLQLASSALVHVVRAAPHGRQLRLAPEPRRSR